MTVETERLTGVRKAMAGAMARSWAEIPHFAEIVLIDAQPLLDRLERVRAEAAPDAPRPSINDLIVHAAIAALAVEPALNGIFVDGRIERPADVAIAFAVATEHGLMTPVVRNAEALSLPELGRTIRDLSERARARRLAPEEFEGAVMTVSNLGAYGVDTGFPVINQRQTALLFAGSLIERPFVIDGQVVARSTLYLTLACDHRIIDGVTSARYLGALRAILEKAEA
ncbi:2-oxo acid dehydrogenase subunit E2 [Sphingosinicella sp. LY1275]|uniref:2-oxo acid dehydrogenase subunit E2 n=1 Tax=Sphingosinicella sp. LY1275 TaxID=3095379 RepID=UPI002ADEF0BC|nr:2-oxo acid dehydrogenase subunit E2 [Sphingosinicella sp. LY1275]MEA1015355.1 2-oxo acid dehydrogenase subunit E2 [Sphingosinicella sp. LY1275]